MNKQSLEERIELITLYKGRDEATYLLSEWEKYGENATPIRQRLHPSTTDSPFAKFKLGEVNAIMKHTEHTLTNLNNLLDNNNKEK